MNTRILVSACLLGQKVRYNATAKAQLMSELQKLYKTGSVVACCPELAAGLPTPRPAAELAGGSGADALAGRIAVIDISGGNVTADYQRAAQLALETAQRNNCTAALLTDGSPTCGSLQVYDGTFKNRRIPGEGVATALLRQNGITVFSETQVASLLDWLEKQEQKNDPV